MERNTSRCDFKALCNLVQIGDKIKKKTSTFHRPVLALKIRLLKEIKNFGKALNKDKCEIIHFSLKYAKYMQIEGSV